MPGVLLIESMAQTSGWLVVAINRFERMPFLAQVKDAKFRTFVTPGQVMQVSAKLVHEGSGFAITKASILIDGKAICEASLTFRVLEFPNEEFGRQMRATGVRVGLPNEVPANG
jgi:3-hydroxyacyl-[acyl-carrier-protein] dehydratase